MEDLRLRASVEVQDALKALDLLDKRLASFQNRKDATFRVDTSPALAALKSLESQYAATQARLRAGTPVSGGLVGPDGKPLSGPASAAPSAPAGQSGPSQTDAEVARQKQLRAEIEAVSNAIQITRNNFIAAGTAADVMDDEVQAVVKRMGQLLTESNRLKVQAAASFGEASREVAKLSTVGAQAQRTIAGVTGQMSRLGIASQFKLGLDNSVLGLQMRAQQGYAGIINLARGYDTARISQALFARQAERGGVAMDAAQRTAQGLADKLKITVPSAEAATTALLRQGFSLQQISTALTGAAASAVATGRTSQMGVDNFVSAVESQSSAMLNFIGLSGNLSTFYQRMAKDNGTVVDKLTAQQRAQAAVNLVMAETKEQVSDLDSLLGGVSGGFSDLDKSSQEAGQELGKALVPAVTSMSKAVTGLLKEFNKLPDGVKNSIAQMALLGVGVGLVAGPIKAVTGGVGGLVKMFKGLTGARAAATAMSEVAAAEGAVVNNGGGVLKFLTSVRGMLTAPATGGASGILAVLGRLGLYGAAFAGGYGIGSLINQIKTLNGLTVGENVTNFFAKTLYGVPQEFLDNQRVAVARQEALTDAAKQTNAELEKAKATGYGKAYVEAVERGGTLTKQLAADVAELGVRQQLGNRQAVADLNTRIAAETKALAAQQKTIDALKEEGRERQRIAPLLKDLKDKADDLAKQDRSIRIQAKSNFAQDFLKIVDDFNEQRKKIEPLLKDKNIDVVIQAESTLSKLDRVQGAAQDQLVRGQLLQNQQERLSLERQTEQQSIALIKDARQRRIAEREAEIRQLRSEYLPKIQALEQDAATPGLSPEARQGFKTQADKLRADLARAANTARASAVADLAKVEEDRARAVQDAQAKVLSAQLEGQGLYLKAVEGAKQRELDLYGGTAEGRLRIEARYQGQLNQLQQAQAATRRQQAITNAGSELQDALRAAETAGARRGQLELEARRAYNQQLRNIDQDYQNSVTESQIANEKAVQDARTAVLQEGLSKRAELYKGFTLAQLAAESKSLAALAAKPGLTPAQAKAYTDQITLVHKEAEAQRLQATKDRLDKELAGLKDMTRAQLETEAASLTSKLQSGTLKSEEVEPYREALKRVQEQIRANREELKKLADEGPKLLRDLGQRLSDLLVPPNQKAVLDAKRPYRELADSVTDAITKIEAALKKGGDPATIARLRAQEAALKGIRDAANVSGDRAGTLAGEKASYDTQRQQLQNSMDLARNDRERALVRAQLDGLDRGRLATLNEEITRLSKVKGAEADVVRLTEERVGILKGLKATGDEELQRTQGRRQAALDLRDAEQSYAEAVARSNAQVLAAQQLGLQNAQARLAELQQELSEADTDDKRRALAVQIEQQRTAIYQKQQGIKQTIAGFDKTSLDLASARLDHEAKLSGLADDSVGRAQLDLRHTREALDLNAQQIAGLDGISRSEAEINQLKIERLKLQDEEVDRQRAVLLAVSARRDLERDVLEAQRKAQAQISGAADDAVASAQLDLELTRSSLGAVQSKILGLDGVKRSQDEILALQKQEAELIGQAAEQERKLLEAQRARQTVLENLSQAQADLNREAAGGSAQTRALPDALAAVAAARLRLTQAERELGRAQADNNPEKQLSATQALTAAIQGQRQAVEGLAKAYRDQLAQQDAVREAGEKLKGVLGIGLDRAIDPNRAGAEYDRLNAMMQRRDDAVRAVRDALKNGDMAEVARLASDLASQQDRVQQQRKRLEDAGFQTNPIGDDAARALAEQIDRMGINYDQQAGALEKQAEAADKNAQAAVTFERAVKSFADTARLENEAARERAEKLVQPLKTVMEQAAQTFSDRLMDGVNRMLSGAAGGKPSAPTGTSGQGSVSKAYTFSPSVNITVNQQPGQSLDESNLATIVMNQLQDMQANGRIECP